MTKTIFAEPLTEAAYRPYGGIISTEVTSTTSTKTAAGHSFLEIVPTENKYSQAPSGKPGKAVTNLAIVNPQPGMVREYHDPLHDAMTQNKMKSHSVLKGVGSGSGGGGKRVVKIEKLERHKFTTQTFIPMGGNGKYLVVVAGQKEEGPEMKEVRAWVADGGQGVCYGAGVWHAGMCVFDDTMAFGQVQHSNGVQDEDVEFFPLEEALEVVF